METKTDPEVHEFPCGKQIPFLVWFVSSLVTGKRERERGTVCCCVADGPQSALVHVLFSITAAGAISMSRMLLSMPVQCTMSTGHNNWPGIESMWDLLFEVASSLQRIEILQRFSGVKATERATAWRSKHTSRVPPQR